MECQECGKRPATLHFTQYVNGEKMEVRLCEVCSKEKSEKFMMNNTSSFSIHQLLSGLLNINPNFTPASNTYKQSLNESRCEQCGMNYAEFARVGKFGCSHCYSHFAPQLEPILKRLQGGNDEHKGKIPARIGGSLSVRRKISELRDGLKDSIEAEEFERAAALRDEIRRLEKEYRNQQEGGGL